MEKEEILKLFGPKEKIIIIGHVDIGSPIHRMIRELHNDGREIIVVSNEKEARAEAGLPILEEKKYIIRNLPEHLPQIIIEKDKYNNRTGNPIDAIAKKRKY